MAINIPNQITLGRLALSIVFFGLLTFYSVGAADRAWVLPVSFWVFLIAVLSDIVDGYLARSWNQVTAFGRVVDPVVDKVIVCGAFVFFAGGAFHDPQTGANVTGVAPWMVVLILLRELLVSAVRSFVESSGKSFAANWVGKAKMFVQSATACVILGSLAWFPVSLAWLRIGSVWATVIVTALSVIAYLMRAKDLILGGAAMGSTTPSKTESESPPPAKQPASAEVAS